MPETAAFTVAADTADGQVNNNLGLTSTQQDDRTSLNAVVLRGGPQIALHTSEGDITIHRGADQALAARPANTEDSDEPATHAHAAEDLGAPQRLRRLRD